MRILRTPAGLAGGLFLAASTLALAQAVRERTTGRTDEQTGVAEVRRVTEVSGSNVVLQGATRFGKVEDIVFNENGCIDYIVVSADNRYVVVPWAASQLDYRQRVVTLDVTREQLQPLIIEGTNWATTIGQPNFAQGIQRVFGARAIRREQSDSDVRPRSVERRDEVRERDRGDIQTPPKNAPRDRLPDARPGDGDRPRGRDAAAKERERRKDEPKKPQS